MSKGNMPFPRNKAGNFLEQSPLIVLGSRHQLSAASAVVKNVYIRTRADRTASWVSGSCGGDLRSMNSNEAAARFISPSDQTPGNQSRTREGDQN